MYRGRRQPEKAAQEASRPAVVAAEEEEAPRTLQPLTAAAPQPPVPPLAPPTAHGSTVLMKERFTAPFMIYDTAARRIMANPQYDRSLAAELHRVQSILLTKLRTPMQAHLSYTPKELLYELEAALYHVCASLAIPDDTAALRYVLSDGEADPAMPQLESFLAHHNAPAKAVVALAHCLSEGTSHDVLAAFLQMLEQRVQTELDPAVDRRRSEAEHTALRGTKNNLQDMAQLVRDVQTAYRSIDTASQAQRRQPQSDPTEIDAARSPAANAVPAGMVEASFYKVLRWVLAVDTDRRALRAAAAAAGAPTTAAAQSASTAPASVVLSGAAGTAAPTPLTGFAKVAEYDPFTGRLTLERADVAQRWGLLLNAKGLLVGLENELRNSSEAGERLYAAVQQQSGEAGGLAIFEVNRRRIRAVHLTDDGVSASSGDIMQKLRTGLMQPTRTLHLSIEKRKQADLTVPREVLFEVSYQGGEGGVGQRCVLMMERASTSISWGLKLKYLKGSPAVLSDFSPSMKLSGAAKNFLFDMRGRLRVLRVNNQEMAKLSAEEMRSVISGSLLLTLNLQVTDTSGDVPDELEAAAAAATTEAVADADAAAVQAVPAAEQAAETPEAVQEGKKSSPSAVEAAEELEPDTRKVASAAADDVDADVQAELDDAAAAIADDFLQEQEEGGKAAALAEDSATAPEFEDAAGGTTAAIEAAADPFEELDWAKPTTTIGAPGDFREDGDGDGDAEAALDGDGDKAAELGAHDDDDDMPEKVKSAAALDEEADAEAVDAAEDGEKAAMEAPEDGDAAAGEEAAAEGKDAALEALDEDAAEPAKKTRGRKKAQTKKGKKAAAAAAKKAKKTRGARTRSGRKKKSSKSANAEEEEEDGAEPMEAPGGEATKRTAVAEEGEAAAAAAAVEPAADAEADDAIAEPESAKKAKRGRKVKTAAAVVEADEPEAQEKAAAEADAEAQDAEDSGKTRRGGKAAAAEPSADAPFVELPPTSAELAIEQGKQGARKRQKKAQEVEADAADEGGASESAEAEADEAPARVSLNQLLKAKPLTFENEVRLEKFDGSTLELERSSTKQPWNIKVAFAGDDIIMTKLPPFAAGQVKHPFLRSLGAGPQGEVKWVVDGLNGQDLSVMSKLKKTQALDAIKGATKLSFVLKALRK